MQTFYEWDYETLDSNGDIVEHNHADKLISFTDSDKTNSLVLVRDSGNEANGLQERCWSYVQEGKLPEYFQDARGRDTYKVPKRFHDELKKYIGAAK